MEWKRLIDEQPELRVSVLGYDVFYDEIHICALWPDNPNCLRKIRGNDDCSIEYWMPLPEPPTDLPTAEDIEYDEDIEDDEDTD